MSCKVGNSEAEIDEYDLSAFQKWKIRAANIAPVYLDDRCDATSAAVPGMQ